MQKEIEMKCLPIYLLDVTNKQGSNFESIGLFYNSNLFEYFLLSLYQHQVVKD